MVRILTTWLSAVLCRYSCSKILIILKYFYLSEKLCEKKWNCLRSKVHSVMLNLLDNSIFFVLFSASVKQCRFVYIYIIFRRYIPAKRQLHCCFLHVCYMFFFVVIGVCCPAYSIKNSTWIECIEHKTCARSCFFIVVDYSVGKTSCSADNW